MLVREANPKDIPEIINVLKASLGEADLPITEIIWNFKHFRNPFGSSLVLVAEEDGEITGVRAFMRWKWQKGEKIYNTFRAVDTATHPLFQGKGIFKRLTLEAVEIGAKTGNSFVFNTPNDNSRSGYLKMEWREAGNIKVALEPVFNMSGLFIKEDPVYSSNFNSSIKDIESLCLNWNKRMRVQKKIFTPKSLKYLKWRYEDNPLQSYEIAVASNFYIAGYVKKRKNIRELRIAELICNEDLMTQREVRGIIKKWSRRFKVQVVSYAPTILKTGFPVIIGNFGPILTVRKLQLADNDFEQVRNVSNWDYHLGDLELF